MLTEKSTYQIARGSTISHTGRGKAPPKTWRKSEIGSFSTELAMSGRSGVTLRATVDAALRSGLSVDLPSRRRCEDFPVSEITDAIRPLLCGLDTCCCTAEFRNLNRGSIRAFLGG